MGMPLLNFHGVLIQPILQQIGFAL